ncbi:EF-hand domain-containing protein [Sphingomonas sp.]|uniref:EF-hand domain-containing protein n=1 Tax=Sphingomonas sp. TaxID=28214 RepID=UPI0017D2FA1D|nr:EF-hand domain-containing protein [Sphingomonas sp.]MBA4762852.1 EF-hand domain-containing protein [Sphingomonas sp.]
MKKFLTTAAIGAMLAAGTAIAMQSEAPTAPKQPVSKAEMLARADARFDRLDTNKDGQLSADERKAGAEAARAAMAEKKGGELQDFVPGARRGGGGMGERMLARVDTNGDGLISKAENRAMVEARFARMDADKDGTVEVGEGRKGMGKGKGKWKRGGEGRGPGGPGGPAMAMKKADTNGDGAISKAEFDAMSAQRFAKLDTNKDGKIDAAEMQAQRDKARDAMKKMRERRGNTPPPPPAPPGT